MAFLTNTNVLGNIESTGLINKIDDGYYKRKPYVEYNTTVLSIGTTWTLGFTLTNITDFKKGSLIRLTYHVPARDGGTNWGGLYIEPQVSFNLETWQSLGSSGFEAVMNSGAAAIDSYFQKILIDPQMISDFSTQFRFYFKTYDGTTQINNNEINVNSSTAIVMSGNNGGQHYFHITVEEYALIK